MLIFRGLFKKVVISSYMATIVDPVFALPNAHSRWEVLWAIYAYAIQIYADFSGYTDMAIGIALLLGIRFPQNFDAPYRSLSVQDFWRRWHMTLSRWLRDYLYIPLGGNRGTKRFTYRNLFLTMVIGGLWHGANWTFVIWGALQGGYLVGRARRQGAVGRARADRPAAAAGEGRCSGCSPSTSSASPGSSSGPELLAPPSTCIGRLFSGGGSADAGHAAADRHGRRHAGVAVRAAERSPPRSPSGSPSSPRCCRSLALGVGLVLVDALGPEGIAPFIYFQF